MQKFGKKDQMVIIFIDFRSAYNCTDMSVLFNFLKTMSVLEKDEVVYL
jgi:hypothetical protein